MHPDVCRLLSEMVYDGRLEPEAQNAHQMLLLNQDADPRLAETGVRFVSVRHTGCSHWSLPSSPVELEQCKGWEHLYQGHALRKNLAATGVRKPFWAGQVSGPGFLNWRKRAKES